MKRSQSTLTFLALLLLFTGASDSLLALTHSVAGGLVVTLFMWAPGLATIVTCRLYRIDLRTLGWLWPPWRTQALAFLLPWTYILPTYVATWLIVKHSFGLSAFEAGAADLFGIARHPHLVTYGLDLPLLLTGGILVKVPYVLGEELGWRGFLLPQLSQRFGPLVGCFGTGVVWAIWHYPLYLAAGFPSGPNRMFGLGCFSVMVIGLSFIFGWLRFKAASIWPCVLLHATHNLLLQFIFDPLTITTGRAPFLVTEFGSGLMVAVCLVAFLLWRTDAK